MSVRNLRALLEPRSVALIGASSRPQSVGATVMHNLLHGGFAGAIFPVNPKYEDIAGTKAYARIRDLPQCPDLAVICTPPPSVPGLIAELGAVGTKAAIVLTAGLGVGKDKHGRTLTQLMLDAARPHLLRILGPNCVGLQVPGIGLNASFAHTAALRGSLAFISQSGALITTVLDWAKSRGIGFSHLVSVGDRADVDFADLIDIIASDANTRAILLYIESIKTPRKFMSAARAAARNKPVIVVKAGRTPAGATAAMSHTGALAGADSVFDAAIRRAGMLRVDTLLDLFAAVETLSHRQNVRGDRLAIMTNGGGAGVMAADYAVLGGGVLASLSQATIDRLDKSLPVTWSRANPVDIIGDAPPERYVETLKALVEDQQNDAVVFMHAPTAIVPSEAIAAACVPVAKSTSRPLLSCWLGDTSVAKARGIFHAAGIADYGTPEEAVQAFLQLVSYRRNQELLMEAPPSSSVEFTPDIGAVKRLVAEVVGLGRELLSEPEARAVLAAYAIPVVETRTAATGEEAAFMADSLGFPVALKVLSPDISHKSDVGGVVLHLETSEAVLEAANAMLRRVAARRPGTRVSGFTVQRMIERPQAHELIVGAAVDPLFGPVILFGHGGTAVEVIHDRAVGLPPLNLALARMLVARTRVADLLAGYRDRPRADHEALYLTLVKVSQLVIDVPEIVELDINPLLIDDRGVLALDARIRVARASASGSDRLAIRPYPRELEERIVWDGRQVLLRPIRPEDETQHRRFVESLDAEDIRMRVFQARREISHSELARLTQIDFEREMAFIATAAGEGGVEQTLGVVRAMSDPDNVQAEMGIIVRSDLKGRGLGRILLDKMVRYCRAKGTREIVGDALQINSRMLQLAEVAGFEISGSDEPGAVKLRLVVDHVRG